MDEYDKDTTENDPDDTDNPVETAFGCFVVLVVLGIATMVISVGLKLFLKAISIAFEQ